MYAKLHAFLHNNFNVNIRGLGLLYRKIITKDVLINFNKKKQFYLKSSISDNYGRLIFGKWNEPETHIFIQSITENLSSFVFIDIGANVGEFILDLFDHPKVNMIYAFEPQKDHFFSLEQLVIINNIDNTQLVNKAVSNTNGKANFNVNRNNRSNSSLVNNSLEGTVEVETITLDTFFSDKKPLQKPIILIDVEGAELDVMKGGIGFIKEFSPVIIFEYNHVTKDFFQIGDVKRLLGDTYKVFRLNKHGEIDENFQKTWNLVAIPNDFKL